MGKDEEVARGLDGGQQKDASKLLRSIRYLDGNMDVPDDRDQRIVKVVIKGPEYYGGEFFSIVAADGDNGEPLVAFHTAESLAGVLVGLGNRVRNGSLKWRADEYRNTK